MGCVEFAGVDGCGFVGAVALGGSGCCGFVGTVGHRFLGGGSLIVDCDLCFVCEFSCGYVGL